MSDKRNPVVTTVKASKARKYPSSFIARIEKHRAVSNAWYEDQDGYWVNLNDGWFHDSMDEIHEYTQKDVLRALSKTYQKGDA